MEKFGNWICVFLLVALLLVGQTPTPAYATGSIRYVKPSPSGTGSCNSWANACALQHALGLALSGDQLWVRQGTYKPGSLQSDTFTLKNGVRIYGGFAGTETLLNQRNPATHITILSGDIGIAGNASDNIYHVVVGGIGIDTSAVLDGFTVTAGNANGASDSYGGGMLIKGGSPTLRNLTFSGNSAAIGGGGMYNYSAASPALTNVTFSGNSATTGGGMYNDGSSPTLTNVTFHGNSAPNPSGVGGAMFNIYSSSPILTNTTFSGNSDASIGGAIYNYSSNPQIYDGIFWGNGSVEMYNFTSGPTIADSLVAGGCPSGASCTGALITSDPLLGPLANNGGFTKTMAVGTGSPAIDAGNNSTCASTDQRGVARPQGPRCDIGAYEAPVTKAFYSSGSLDGWVLESGENTSVGGVRDSSGALYLGDSSTRKQYRSILSFSTASLPNNSTITSVKLKLKYSSVSPAATHPISLLHGIMLDVRKGFFGTSALQLADFQQVPAGTVTVGPFSPGLSSGFYTITLSPASFSQINLLATTQIRLRFKLDDNNNSIANVLSLVSGNAPTASNRPTLIIVYTTP